MGTYIRTRIPSSITPKQRRALQLIAKHGVGKASGKATDEADGGVQVNSETAFSLLRQGFVERSGDDRIEVTRKGLMKIGEVRESSEERKRRKMAENLEAQAKGRWKPVPAGYSAAASREAEDNKRWVAMATAHVQSARQTVEWRRETLKWALERDDLGSAAVEELRNDVEEAEADLEAAERELATLAAEQRRAA